MQIPHSQLLPAAVAAAFFIPHVALAQSCVQVLQQEVRKVCPADDRDCDGIADAAEATLLHRYRPFLIFNSDEKYLPTRLPDYIRASTLIKDGRENREDNIAATHEQMRIDPDTPMNVYLAGSDFCWAGAGAGQKCKSDLRENPKMSSLHINPVERAREGVATWSEALSLANIGLYGHVSLVRLPIFEGRPHLPQTCDRDGKQTSEWWHTLPMAEGGTYYKVEYWQFFGYSDANALGVGAHEGDWTSVQLLVRAPPPAVFPPDRLGSARKRILWTETVTGEDSFPSEVVAVTMFMHGLEVRYRLDGPLPQKRIDTDPVMELRGRNFGRDTSVEFASISQPGQCDSDVPNLQDNVLRFMKTPDEGRFTHPLVYLEQGAHEFWPSEDGKYRGAPSHDGKGHRYLAGRVPNLGEFGHPLDDVPEASVIMHYNGRWGAHRVGTKPPFGPTFHGQWNYFPNAALRHCLHKGHKITY